MNKLIIDIDGTLCPIKRPDESYSDLIPYKNMIKKLKECKEKGFQIVLFTSRNMKTYNGDLELIHRYTKPLLETWLKEWNIPYDEIIYGKVWPGEEGFYIDDRAVRPKEFLENSIDDLSRICQLDKKNDNIFEHIFKANDTNIKIRSNNSKIITDLVKLFGSYYEEGKLTSDITINYIVGTTRKAKYEYKEKEQTTSNYIERKDDQINIYMKQYETNDIVFVKRMFTSILIKVLQKKGYVILHGACAGKNGEGIIISGSKRSGKTTTLLNLLYEGYDYIANDRLALKEENGQISVIGIPFSMGIILEDAVKLFDITGCKKAIDKDKKKVYLESNEVGRKFNVGTFSVIKLNTILLPKYNEEVETIEMQNVSDIVLYLGPDNIMTTNAIPEEKKFLNEMFDITYKDASFLNKANIKKFEQSSKTFEQLDSYLKNVIGEKENVLRFTHSYNRF